MSATVPPRSYRPILLIGLTASLALTASPAVADDEAPDRLPAWQRLEFKATKLLITARSALEVESIPGPTSRTAGEATVRLRSTTSMLGRESTTDVWIDHRQHAATQRTLIETGSRQRKKTYRYDDDHVLALRSEPATEAERDLPEPEWTRRSEERIPRPPSDLPLTDPLAIFQVLSTAPLESLDEGMEIEVLSSNSVSRVRMRRTDQVEQVPRRHEVEGGSGDGSGDGPLLLRRYEVAPVDADGELELLGLEGAIEVWIDESLRLPVEIQGRISPVGRVTARLQRAVLR